MLNKTLVNLFLLLSIPVSNGLAVKVLRPLEINLLVVLAGHLLLLKLSLIEFVLLATLPSKLLSLLKICSNVVVVHVVTVVKVVTPVLLGLTSRILVLSLVDFTMIPLLASHTFSLLAIITLLVNINLVVPFNPLPSVSSNAILTTDLLTLLIFVTLLKLTLFPAVSKLSKEKF